MDVSIIITTTNESANLPAFFNSVFQCEKNGLKYEIVLVDANSQDSSDDVVKSFDFLPIVYAKKSGNRCVGLNHAVSLSKGKLLLFTDADCKISRHWIESMWAGHLMFPNDYFSGITIYSGKYSAANECRNKTIFNGKDISVPACNLAIPKSIMQPFNESLTTAEDIDLHYRLISSGHSLIENTTAIVYAQSRKTFLGLVKQSYYYGVGQAQLKKIRPELYKKHSLPLKILISPVALAKWVVGAIGYLKTLVI